MENNRTRQLTSSAAPTANQRLLSAQQVSIETGLPYTTVRDLVFRGALRRVVLPGSRRWWLDRRDVERFIETNKSEALSA